MVKSARALMCVCALLAVVVSHARAQDLTPARAAGEAWLALVDAGRFADSWQAAGAFFRNAVTEAQWQQAVQTARGPFGALTSRALKSAAARNTLPGAPDGEYVVLQYDAVFERKSAAVETLTVTREADGSWRAVGYFIR